LARAVGVKEVNIFRANKEGRNEHKLELENTNEFKEFSVFKKFIELFLGNTFTFELDEDVQSKLILGNRYLDFILLSPGQKTLFAYAIMFTYLELNSEANIAESIIILDEPEKHLHSKAQINLIKKLREAVKDKGQLWIA